MAATTTWQTKFLASVSVLLIFLLVAPIASQAAMLDASAWAAKDTDGNILAALSDNDLATGALIESTQALIRCVVELDDIATLHRVFFSGTRDALNSGGDPITSPRSVNARIYVTDNPAKPGAALATRDIGGVTGREIRVSANLRFQPKAGRYVIIELARGDLINPWNIGEIELYGWPGDALVEKNDAVILPANAAQPLQLAAEELSYYLGEIAGHPIPIIKPSGAQSYTGTIFRIEDLKSLAQSYEQMTNNLANGTLPSSPVNIEREGREIVFRAWPYRNVLWSVWEFLDRQGTKWVYPDAHGDFVPTGRGIDLAIAPLQFTPSSDFIYANFGVEYLHNDPDALLHFWRNRWSHTWGDHQRDVLGGEEVPKQFFPNTPISPEYVEGFEGYPHNFNVALPERILQQHPDWCGILTNSRWASWVGEQNMNRRRLPSQNHSTFDLSSEGAREFIINKAIAYWNEHAKYRGNIYWMLPEDSTFFSEDEASVALRQPLREDMEPYAMPYPYSVSGDYFDFIRAIASGIAPALPEAKVGGMAYSNTHLPPENMEPLPDNVIVDICMYGARNLPFSSPKNGEMKRRLLAWQSLVADRRHYDYDLIHREEGALKMPVPLVSAMADRAKVYAGLNMLRGGTQADLDTIPYNPWNYYAYPRFRWNIQTDANTVLNEFFNGYFAEVGETMRTWYDTLERYLIANDVSLQARGYDYGLRVGAYPPGLLRRLNQLLSDAENHAHYWVTRERLRKLREGMDWILEQRGLSYDELNEPTAFISVSPEHSATIDLRFAAIQTAGQDVGDAWFLFSWAQVGDYVWVQQPGRYRVSVTAGIGYTNPEPGNRQMLVHIGGMQYGPFVINHETMDTYTLFVEIPAGVFEVAVEDLYNRGPFRAGAITIAHDDSPAFAPRRGGLVHIFDFASEGNTVDSDWDGVSDLHESVAGTDPYDTSSFFAATSIQPTEYGTTIRWPSVAGRVYALYRSISLRDGFALMADNLTATPPENSFTVSQTLDGSAFYQIAVR